MIVLCWGFELFLLLGSQGAVLAFAFSSHSIITSHACFWYDSRIFHICVWSYNSLVTFWSVHVACIGLSYFVYLLSMFRFWLNCCSITLSSLSFLQLLLCHSPDLQMPPQLYSLIFVFIAKYCHSAKSLSCNVCSHHRKGILELGYYILSYQASQCCTVQTPIQSYFNMSTIFILN